MSTWRSLKIDISNKKTKKGKPKVKPGRRPNSYEVGFLYKQGRSLSVTRVEGSDEFPTGHDRKIRNKRQCRVFGGERQPIEKSVKGDITLERNMLDPCLTP